MALVENQWATEDELSKLDEEGKKKKLISSLALKLSPEKHTALGLALREVFFFFPFFYQHVVQSFF